MLRMLLATRNPARMLKAAEMLLDSANGYRRLKFELVELADTALIFGSIAAQTSTPSDQANSLTDIQTTIAEFLERQIVAKKTPAPSNLGNQFSFCKSVLAIVFAHTFIGFVCIAGGHPGAKWHTGFPHWTKQV